MTTILLLSILATLYVAGFWGAALGVAGGLYGGYQERRAQQQMAEDRKMAIRMQVDKWRKAYAKSQGEFDAARQGILGREQSQYGGLTAGLASSGLLNTTVAGNMARGVRSDTNQALTGLASQQAAAEYGKWMDLAQIKSQWAGIHGGSVGEPGQMAQGWGQFGAELGSLFDKK